MSKAMRILFVLCCLLIAALPSSAANFPYIRLNGKTNQISDNGTALTRDGVAIGGGSSPWYSQTTTNVENGPTVAIGSYNNTLTNAVLFSSQFLTNFLNDFSTTARLGYPNFDNSVNTNANTGIFAIGDYAGWQTVMSNTKSVFLLGPDSGATASFTETRNIIDIGGDAGTGQTIDSSVDIYNFGASAGLNSIALTARNNYNFGDNAGKSQISDHSDDIFNFGHGSGTSLHATNSADIYSYGDNSGPSSATSSIDLYFFGDVAGAGMKFNGSFDNYFIGTSSGKSASLTNSSDIFNIGNSAGMAAGGTYSHVFVLGSGGTATNSNDFVFGDTNYNYFFPGASATFAAIPTVNGIPVSTNSVITTNFVQKTGDTLSGTLTIPLSVPMKIDTARSIYTGGGGQMTIGSSGAGVTFDVNSGNVYIPGTLNFQSSMSPTGGNVDLSLVRDGANALAQRNGTNAQTFAVYNKFTDSSNYERAVVKWSGDICTIGVEALGSGTLRQLKVMFGTNVLTTTGTNLMFNGGTVAVTY